MRDDPGLLHAGEKQCFRDDPINGARIERFAGCHDQLATAIAVALKPTLAMLLISSRYWKLCNGCVPWLIS